MENYDAIIIGSGPAGQKAALASSKMGKSVAIIEGWDIGGSSLHTGTIPSKTLREAILDLTNFQQKSFYAKKRLYPKSANNIYHRFSPSCSLGKKSFEKHFKKATRKK